MSKSAEQYYQQRAKSLGIDEIPPILDGRPRILWQTQDVRGSAVKPNSKMQDVLEDRYGKILESIGGFVLTCAGRENVAPQQQHPEGQKQTDEHIAQILSPGELLPRASEARVSAVYVQAVPDYEIGIDAARIAFTKSPWRVAPKYENESIFLHLGAVCRADRHTALRQAHVIAHPHEFYQPATVQHRTAMYESEPIAAIDMDVRKYLAQMRALPIRAEV